MISQNPLVSIIIPTYNAERFLALTIESVQAQTRLDWNLIIIDDGSKDGTVALAQSFAAKDNRIRVVPYPNGGVVVARNRGFAESKSDSPYLAYLDHDDLWDANFLETLIPILDERPAAVGVHGVARIIDANGEPCEVFNGTTYPRERLAVVGDQVIPVAQDAPTSFAVLAVLNYIATPGQALLRRAAVEQAGLFRLDTNPCDDWDLYLRMTQASDILFINKPVMGWRQHETNVSNDEARMMGTGMYVRRKIIEEPTTSAEHRRMMQAGYRYWQKLAAQRWLESAQDCFAQRRFARAANHTRFAIRSYLRGGCGKPTKAEIAKT